MKETPTVPLFLRLRPQVKRAFEALARKRGLGKAQMFERLMAERQEPTV
mgnify:FL=1